MSSTGKQSGATKAPAEPNKWLIAYNSISSSFWSIVLFNTVFLGSLEGQPILFNKTNLILTVIQCFAVVEIFNSALGIVKSPIVTTTAQVFSRLLLVLGIMQLLPNSPANYHWCYITLTLSWSITEIIRYSYYASNLSNPNGVPYFLTWLRYSTFWVLYPTGVSSEIAMIYLSLDEAKNSIGSWYYYFLIATIATYAPGFYTLYTYMIKQRKKVLGKISTNSNEKKSQ
ncbi:PTPLA-domain-containing protein [Hyphopichia burtonii NRRL Y-1933]|uniref:Very-long-chain (3R)-3-hydroxyacyl-CoA dehydratase n=1 Tax=Hyphopichia burtonii NRRL Y-1933 TaxID=984485 RepID=A0A1E4RTD6_9ASCO|nr:PTPLA-domain-containing protein [Hyphopichia burtonii NRRL Y-1933]ODV70315.1 PTPLA-domain-containing protein [Hyphopichia burtonii NRRL Y-1933]